MATAIWVVEDDENIAELIKTALLSASYEARVFDCGAALFERGDTQVPDLILLDIMLPGMSGYDILKRLRTSKDMPDVPVIFLTAKGTEFDKAMGLELGADDYIPKPFSIEVLRKKVQAVLKRTGGGKSRIRYRDLEVDTDKCLVMLNGEEVRLTSTEYKLLCYLIENKGRIVTKAMLLEQLWDIDGNFVDENTVRVNIKRLRQKLNDDKQEYIVTVFGMGYTFGE